MRNNALALLLGALVFSSCPAGTGAAYDPARIVRSAIPGDLLGMVHAGSSDEAGREYALLDELGVRWMLTDFSWSSIQPQKEAWNLDAFAAYADNGETGGKKILAVLDYDTPWLHPEGSGYDGPVIKGPDERALFCAYVKKTVERYKDRVDAWCIWNEPNLQPRFWASAGTKDDFFALTKAAAAAVREADPEAFIVGGAFNTLASEDWVRGMFTSGAMDRIDAIAYHPYMTGPGATANLYIRFKDLVSEYGFGDKIWITEVGYPTYDAPPRPAGRYGTDILEADMPETVMQTIVLLAVNGARRIFWYHLFDPRPEAQDNADSEDWFGLVKRDAAWTWKGGAAAYRLAAQNIPGRVCKTPEREGLPDFIQAYYFEGSDGRHALVIWNDINVAEGVGVCLPGTNQKVYNLASGEAAAIGETSTYTLKAKDGDNHFIRFFTWENPGSLPPPRISARQAF
ncbi:MAG: hypothetical protein LBE17_13675 [Treponema sp.]|jgi:hypothetical protein|nr:hypothetical protein [Treponema sp.]